jgi:hypothetical protein
LLSLEGNTKLHGRPLPEKKAARLALMRMTGQDFGYDAQEWQKWMNENRKGLYKRVGRHTNRWRRWLDEKRKGRDKQK